MKVSYKAIYIVIMTCLLTNACMHKPEGERYAVSVIHKMPVNYTNVNGHLVGQYLVDTVSLFFLGEYIFVRMRPSADWGSQQNIKGTEPYFIRKKNEKYGFHFRSASDRSTGERFDADTFMTSNGLQFAEVDFPVGKEIYQSGSFEDTSMYVAKFTPVGSISPDENPDTVFYVFSKKMKGLKFSFSKKLDSLTAMKLCKVRFFYKEGYSKQRKAVFPEHEMFTEMVLISPVLSDKEKALLEHCKKVNW